MEQENVDAQVDTVEQEEQVSDTELDLDLEESDEESKEEPKEEEVETVTVPKSEYKSMKRKAIAYDSGKKGKTEAPPQAENSEGYLEDVFMVKDLSQDEYDVLKSESNELGIPFKKYLVSKSGKNMLTNIRKEQKSKNSMEGLSSKSPVYKKFTEKDIAKMSAKEMEKILSE